MPEVQEDTPLTVLLGQLLNSGQWLSVADVYPDSLLLQHVFPELSSPSELERETCKVLTCSVTGNLPLHMLVLSILCKVHAPAC